ncbi:MAG: hypothetical protein CSA32_01425 [Desulfobulbus propionicus]|nr:MAG: hypothetical protein CSA32_01425 [Desulfobulbus propionicus]
MYHFSFPAKGSAPMQRNLCRTLLALLVFCELLYGSAALGDSLNEVLSVSSQDGSEIRITSTMQPTYTAYELFSPQRVVVDIAQAKLAQDFSPVFTADTGLSVRAEELTDTDPPVVRLEFTLAGESTFKDSLQERDIIIALEQKQKQNLDSKTASAEKVVSDVTILSGPEQTIVRLMADSPLTNYTYDVLESDSGKPARMFIDINNVSGSTLLQEHKVGTSLDKIRVAERGTGLRFVFDSSSEAMFPFSVQPTDSGLEVIITEKQKKDQIATLISEKTAIDSQLPEVDPLQEKNAALTPEGQLEEAFNFSGYTKERITVDFYKIDLHNVFRLFREVSGINIVVAEGVSGSLTLALDDVPWDFALDIILNLKGLVKEERFNTLVIYPKDGEFNWAQKNESTVSFEPDIAVTEQEALIIKQQKALPKGVIEAKRVITQAKKAEELEDYELAVSIYEQAFALWQDNAKLANKIAALYLVRLRQNAKAAYYAKKALAVEPENTSAALNAAIANANMQEKTRAIEYFDQSISGEKPSKEALLSYAVFSEEQKEYAGALKLLEQHDSIYGKSLRSMVATARIFDTMGNHETATEKYKAILLAGFRVPPDLKKYINSRLAHNKPGN